jgi:hypothetical protein
MSERKQVSVERVRATVAKMTKGARRTAITAFAFFVSSSAEIPSNPQLPSYEPSISRTDEDETSRVATPEAPLLQISAEATTRGANHLFYSFFRKLRYTNPEAYERFAGTEGPLAVSERFSQETGFWQVGDGISRSAILQPGDRVALSSSGEIVFFDAAGTEHPLTADGRPIPQEWPEF